MTNVAATTIRFTAADGTELVGDLRRPDGDARAAAIVCHPHPQFGGNRHNHVVGALFDALPAASIAALRFDFRIEFDDGRGERLDASAALDALAEAVPGVPLIAAGYSFGAAVALALADASIAARVLVAPPLAMVDVEPGRAVPTLVLTPEHDQFSPPESNEPIVAAWSMSDHDTIAGADHFLAAHADVAAAAAAAAVTRWLDAR